MRRRAASILVMALAVFAPSVGAYPVVPSPPETRELEFVWSAWKDFVAAGLGDESAYAVRRTSDGFVYVGTESGLLRYDGKRFELVGSIPSRRCFALAEAKGGRLFVGTHGAGLFVLRLDDGTAARTEVPAGRVLDLSPDGRGGVFASTDQGLWHCPGEGLCVAYEPARGLPVYRTRLATWRGEPVLWLGLAEGGVRRIADPLGRAPRLEPLTLSEGLPNDLVRALLVWSATGEDLWIGTGRGLARYDGERLIRYGKESGFPEAMVFALAAGLSAKGEPELYVALRPGGLVIIDPEGRWRRWTAAQGLPANEVQGIWTGERPAELWLATLDASVLRREPERFQAIDERFGLPDRVTYGVGETLFPDGGRSLWVGTMEGARRVRDGRWEAFLPRELDAFVVRDIVGNGRETFIAGDAGLVVWDAEGFRRYSRDVHREMPARSIDRLAVLSDRGEEEVYLGSGHGLSLFRPRSETFRRLSLPGGPDVPILGLLARPAEGAVLALTPRALLRVRGEAVAVEAVPCADSGEFVTMAGEEMGGPVWIAQRERVFRLGRDECQGFAVPPGIGPITGLVMLEGSALLMLGGGGAIRVPGDWAGEESRIERFGHEDGLESTQLRTARSALRSSSGHVYLSTGRGLVGLEPRVSGARIGEEPLVVSWLVDGRPARAGFEALEPGVEVGARVRLLSFLGEHRIRYRFRLRDEVAGTVVEDSGFVASGDIGYRRLTPGRYRLEVEAAAADGSRHGPVTLNFVMLAPWWQRPWAVAAGALALAALGWLSARARVAFHRRRARELQRAVEERTEALARANAELDRLARVDSLTGLGNRRALAELERSRPIGADTLVVIIDIDHFKSINDRFGHRVGDEVLAELGARLRAVSRRGDQVLRYGGEEFVLVAEDGSDLAALALLRRLLAAVGDHPFRVSASETPLEVTVSAGAARLVDAEPAELSACLALADEALYGAKEHGRDQAWLIHAQGEAVLRSGRRARIIRREEVARANDPRRWEKAG
jgi:diguanylate cyclase (GGDEF)-like protein